MIDLISRQSVLALPRNRIRNMRGEIVEESINVADIETLPSAQPESCEDTISRKEAIDGFYEMASDTDHLCTVGDYISFLESLSSAQPTLYGYKIEHLAYIARVMEKEGITAEYAVKTFDDIKRAVKMILDETQQKAEEILNGCRPPEPYKEEE